MKEIIEKHFQRLQKEETYLSSLWDLLNEKVVNQLFLITTHEVEIIIELLQTKFDIPEIQTWVEWFVYETGFGKKSLQCSVGEDNFNIDSFDTFWELLISLEKTNKDKGEKK
jgi:hypothetical protein